MIRAYLLLLLTFFLGIAAVTVFVRDSGYVLIHYGSYSVETSLMGLLAALLIGAVLLWVVLRILVGAARLPLWLRKSWSRRSEDRASRSFELGLLRFFEADWARAETDLIRRVADHPAAYLNYLAAARAAHRSGAALRRDHYLDLALRHGPNAEFAALFTRAELAFQDRDFAAARDVALKLRARNARHPETNSLLCESYAATAEWTILRQLLSETADLARPTPERRKALWAASLCGEIEEASWTLSLPRLRSIWEGAGIHREDPAVQLAYIRALIAANAQNEAAAQIQMNLTNTYDAGLVRLYGELTGIDAVGQLASVEVWLAREGEHSELLLAAGSAAIRCHLWGKARGYLDACLRLKPDPSVYLQLAQLCEQTQNPLDASRFYREGLKAAYTV